MSLWRQARRLVRACVARRHALTIGGVLIVTTMLLATALNPFVDTPVTDAAPHEPVAGAPGASAEPTPSISASPTPSPSVSASPPPRPSPPPGQCRPEDLMSHARSRHGSYGWWSGDEGD